MPFGDVLTSVVSLFLKGHLVILVVGLAPGLFWLWFFYRRDLEPEPIRLVATSFLVGALVFLPAIWLQGNAAAAIRSAYPLLSQQTRLVIDMTILAPISEEILKFLATLLILRCIKEFNEPLDGVIYGVSVALGFATLENIGYVLKASQTSFEALTATAVTRAVLSVPSHALYACLWGYALGYAHFYKEGRVSPLYPLFGLGLGIVTHSLFNLAAMFTPVIGFALVVVVVILWEMAEPRMAKLLLRSPHRTLPEYRERLVAMRERFAPLRAESQWYEKKSTVLIMLFLVFAPAGLYGLFKSSCVATRMKWVYFIIWLGITVVATLQVK
jgi:RsiW-degrading membrane proteinase PrsW (M82 family)